MRRQRWWASIGAVALAVAGLVTVGAGASAAALLTSVSGTVWLPEGLSANQIHMEAVGSSGEYLSGTQLDPDGSFELWLDVSEPTTFTLEVQNWANGAFLTGWVYYPGETAILASAKAQATVIHVAPGIDSVLDPISIDDTTLLTVTASGPTGQPLPEDDVWGYELVDPGSGDQTGAGWLDWPTGVFSGFTQVVGVNRQSGLSPYTGRYYAGDGVLGTVSPTGATAVTFTAGQTRALDVRLDTCGTVSGTVSGGQDLNSRRVTVFNDEDPALVTRQSEIAADGTFEVSGLLPGDYFVAPVGFTASYDWVEGAFYQDADPTAGDPAPLTIASCSTHVTGVGLELPEASGVVPVIPERVKDDATVAPGAPRCVQVAGVGSVPLEATGVVLNVTTDRPTGGGYVVVYPDTAGNGATPPPAGSTVNFEPGQAVANSAFVQLPADGKVCYYTAGAPNVRVVLDVTSFLMPDAGVTTQASQRLLDTRGGGYHVGTVVGPVAPRVVKTVQVTGQAGVPAGASAVLLNVTVVGATGAGNLRVFPGGEAVPNTSVINYAPGQTKASATIVSLPASGTVSFYSDAGAPVDVILDVVGSVAPGGAYHAISPTRVIDTRPTSLIGDLVGPLAGRNWYEAHLGDLPVVPAEATAVVLNVTAIGPTGQGNLRVFPSTPASEPPNASTLNYIPGRDIPNLVVVGLEPWAWVTFWSDTAGMVNVAVDIVGYIGPVLPG